MRAARAFAKWITSRRLPLPLDEWGVCIVSRIKIRRRRTTRLCNFVRLVKALLVRSRLGKEKFGADD